MAEENENKVLGKFVWHDLMTNDVDKAVSFYTGLFGWTIKEVDMGPMGTYKMIQAAGTEHGGFVGLAPEDNLPSHWTSYVTVDDVDATVARAVELGGKAPVPPMDIPGTGRFAVIVDPHGAVISPYTPKAWGGEGAAPQAGTFCWHELLAVDPEAEGAFFRELFGWTSEAMDMGPMGTYHIFKRGEKMEAGALQKPEGQGGPSAWLPYIAVDDVDATAARVEGLGGKIFVPPTDIPDVGRFSVLADPTGASIALLQALPMAG